jgi:helix-turn-helix protein
MQSSDRPKVVTVSESSGLLADFMGRFALDGTWDRESVEGRVLLNDDQLVLVGPDQKEVLQLSRMVDVVLEQVPQEYSQYFNSSVVVAFASPEQEPPRTATIEADGDAADRLGWLLFRTQLHARTVLLNHPSRIGGRVASGGFESATLYLGEESVSFGDINTPFRVPLDSVVGFGRPERTVQGAARQVLSIRHVQGGTSMMTEIDVRSKQRRTLMGRILRIEYGKRRAEISDLDLSAKEKELLVALHSGGGAADLAVVLGIESSQVSMLLNGLEDEGLVETSEDGVHLTSTGRIALEEHLDDTNQ